MPNPINNHNTSYHLVGILLYPHMQVRGSCGGEKKGICGYSKIPTR